MLKLIQMRIWRTELYKSQTKENVEMSLFRDAELVNILQTIKSNIEGYHFYRWKSIVSLPDKINICQAATVLLSGKNYLHCHQFSVSLPLPLQSYKIAWSIESQSEEHSQHYSERMPNNLGLFSSLG